MVLSFPLLMCVLSLCASSLRCQIVTVPSGGKYHLHSLVNSRHTSLLVENLASNSFAEIFLRLDDIDSLISYWDM